MVNGTGHLQRSNRSGSEQCRNQDVQDVGEYSMATLWLNLDTELGPECGANADDLLFNSPPKSLLRAIPLTISIRCLKPCNVTGQLRRFQGFPASLSLVLGELRGLHRQPEPLLGKVVFFGFALGSNRLNTHFLHSALPPLVVSEHIDLRIPFIEVDKCLLFLTCEFDCHLAFTALQWLFLIRYQLAFLTNLDRDATEVISRTPDALLGVGPPNPAPQLCPCRSTDKNVFSRGTHKWLALSCL